MKGKKAKRSKCLKALDHYLYAGVNLAIFVNILAGNVMALQMLH
jgi:hypothetical protein